MLRREARIRARLDEEAHDARVASLRGEVQRRVSVLVLRVHVAPDHQEVVDRVRVSPQRGDVQGVLSDDVRFVDVAALRDERLEHFDVAVFRGAEEARVAARLVAFSHDRSILEGGRARSRDGEGGFFCSRKRRVPCEGVVFKPQSRVGRREKSRDWCRPTAGYLKRACTRMGTWCCGCRSALFASNFRAVGTESYDDAFIKFYCMASFVPGWLIPIADLSTISALIVSPVIILLLLTGV